LQFNAMRHLFMSRGSDPVQATNQARAALFGMVQSQASMISYNSVFMLLGIMFLVMLPFALLMHRAKVSGGAIAAH
jgi:hypothetical protein